MDIDVNSLNELPDSIIVLHYMSLVENETLLESVERHNLLLKDGVWRWTQGQTDGRPLAESRSLREVARDFANHARPFEYAHIEVASATEGSAFTRLGEIFPLDQLFEEIALLFEDTPDFRMDFGEKTLGVRSLTTWAPSHLVSNSERSQSHLLIFDETFCDSPMNVVFLNSRMTSPESQLDRWDQIEVAFLCNNELLVFQTFRGTAQHVSDSRSANQECRSQPLEIETARDFLRFCATSLSQDGDLFSDAWGNLQCSPLGEYILFNRMS